ncbi:MAG: hypothetical protein QOF98_873, partial [Streptomyces sp.]|nr:hypothetical protein [Streptomyces sp.]
MGNLRNTARGKCLNTAITGRRAAGTHTISA